jgi:aldehyde:ferredoxin oxidoreductase
MAGYGAIVIRGAASRPLYLAIEGDEVSFHDASALWGLSSSYTAGSVLRVRHSGSGLRSIMRIGRGGEEGVRYACVTAETYRHFGRLGLGAVFGSKKLKALLIGGKRALPVGDRRAYRRIYDEIYKAATESTLMIKYHELGTPMGILPMNTIGALPTRNLQDGRFEGAEAISGERLAADYLGRRVACAHCPVACIHLAALRLPYPQDPYFFKTMMLGYDYELIYSLGSMVGIDDVPGMLLLMDEAELQGLDAMSTGVALAWATEALERGLISTEETGGLALAWGDHGTYIEAVKRIVQQPNEFYRALACGVEHAASIYGGQEFALALGGNEMPGYHTGAGGYLGYLTGARHSHLDSAGYSLDQKNAKEGLSPSPEELAGALLAEERWRQVLTSLSVCLFARGLYTPEVVEQALAATGIERSPEDLAQLGRETLHAKHQFKVREGFDMADLRLPRRIFETPAPTGGFDEAYVRRALAHFADHV